MEQRPPEDPNNPYGAMWQMSPVGDSGRRKVGGDLKLGVGVLGGLIAFAPFALVASVLWGWWSGSADVNWGPGGWAFVIIGLAAGFSVGAFLASDKS